MNFSDPDNPSENEWDDRGELAWNEFDWEHYLRDQDELIHRYIGFYEQLEGRPDRLDEVAHRMRWDQEAWSTEEELSFPPEVGEAAAEPANERETDPYTLHKNPVFIATKGILLTLVRAWERTAEQPDRVPQKLALTFHSTLHRAEQQAMFAISALDFGDYAMAISLLKRALQELNQCFALLSAEQAPTKALGRYQIFATPRLFDLREIWLRVMNDCRDELENPSDDEEDD